jgi:hypothetical protein
MILPVPVTLNLFLALEFVFTLGILNAVKNVALEAVQHWLYTYGASLSNNRFYKRCAKVKNFS